MHLDFNRDSGYDTGDPDEDIIKEPRACQSSTWYKRIVATPVEDSGFNAMPETQTEQDDSSVMTGYRETPFVVHTNTFVHWHLSEVMSHAIMGIGTKQRSGPMAGQHLVVVSSHSICKELFHNLSKFDF